MILLACASLLLTACGAGGVANGTETSSSNNAGSGVPAQNAVASLNYSAASVAPGASLTATLVLSNAGAASVKSAGLTIDMPSGFAASNFTQGNPACGGNATTQGTQIILAGAVVPASGSCSIQFTLATPVLALAANYSPAIGFSDLSNVTAGSITTLTLNSNTPTSTPSALGVTPGLDTYWWLPSTMQAASEMDFTITPNTDPGPNSDVFWSNQIFVLNGYTGMQTTMLEDSVHGSGRQFLFSLWGAVAATAGTLPGQPVSTCTVSSTADDGSAGAQCRVLYAWQVGHTYRFRVTAQGNSWYKSNVTDVTPGVSNPISFDIGSIQQNVSTYPNLINTIPKQSNGASDAVQFLEYFDWNNHRTTCLSVPYTDAVTTMAAVDATTGKTTQLPPGSANGTGAAPCGGSDAFTSSSSNQIAGIGQTSQGLVKANGLCLASLDGFSDGTPAGSNSAVVATCPTLQTVQQKVGSAFSSSFWVYAQDKSLQNQDNYCLTIVDGVGGAGAAVAVESCVPGAINQQWQLSGPSGGATGQNLVSVLSGNCVDPQGKNNNVVNLATCSTTTSSWAMPGESFSY